MLIVIRIPYWRTFVVNTPARHQLVHDIANFYRRLVRPLVFKEIERGNDQAVIKLSTPKRLKKWRGEWGESALLAAIRCKRSELACNLIGIGGSFPNDGALVMAAMYGDVLVVEALLSNGKNPDESLQGDESKGVTPLMWAANQGYFAIMQMLLAAGADVNAVAQDGSTAVMFTRNGTEQDLGALEILCKHKSDITIKDWRGRNLIQEAIDCQLCSGKPEMRQLLERYYPEINFDSFKD